MLTTLRNKSCAQKADILHVKNTVCCRGLNDYLQYKIRSPVLHVSMSQPHIRLLQKRSISKAALLLTKHFIQSTITTRFHDGEKEKRSLYLTPSHFSSH